MRSGETRERAEAAENPKGERNHPGGQKRRDGCRRNAPKMVASGSLGREDRRAGFLPRVLFHTRSRLNAGENALLNG
jgi:hypothetical protein